MSSLSPSEESGIGFLIDFGGVPNLGEGEDTGVDGGDGVLGNFPGFIGRASEDGTGESGLRTVSSGDRLDTGEEDRDGTSDGNRLDTGKLPNGGKTEREPDKPIFVRLIGFLGDGASIGTE